MELSSLDSRRRSAGRLQAGGAGDSSPWAGIGFGRKGSGGKDQNERLLGEPGSSPSSSSFSSSSAMSSADVDVGGVGGPQGLDPCVVCCTLFSSCAAFLLILLGIYAAADRNGEYLILRTREQENPFVEELRMTKVGHIFGAAALYLFFVAGCGFKWYNRQPLWQKKR
jgi:hypothetical protein